MISVMQFFYQYLITTHTISFRQEKCSTLFVISVCTLRCQMKGKKKREPPHTLERTPGMVGNEEYVLPPLTYASVDESMGNYNNYWT